ncbi:hypothetical protein QQ045_011220 [Rhodiola kirilowii]
MMKRVFIFSDMEFDQATMSSFEYDSDKAQSGEGNEDDEPVDYEEIERKKKEMQRESWKTDYEVIQTNSRSMGIVRCLKLCFGT